MIYKPRIRPTRSIGIVKQAMFQNFDQNQTQTSFIEQSLDVNVN